VADEKPEPRPPVGVAFDGDLATRPDALLALALLNGLTAKQEARRISLSVSRPSLTAARLADVIAEFYPTLPLGAGYLTVGMLEGPVPRDDAPALARMLATKTPEGAAVYDSRVQRPIDVADNATLIRNMLLAQHDGNAIVVLAGAVTGLARLLALYGARPQIAAKVKVLVVAVGAYPGGGNSPAASSPAAKAEPSVAADVAAARQLFAEWPTPIVAVGSEVGEAVRFPLARLDEGVAGASAHPIAAACRAIAGAAPDVPTAALAAMAYAIHPEAADFKLSEAGTISVLDDGRTRFVPDAGGRHRYLSVQPAQKGALLASYTSLVSAPPAPRPTKRLPNMVVDPPAAPPAAQPAAAKPPTAQPAAAKPAGAKP
jgi:ABC-type transporter Mla MlaB component